MKQALISAGFALAICLSACGGRVEDPRDDAARLPATSGQPTPAVPAPARSATTIPSGVAAAASQAPNADLLDLGKQVAELRRDLALLRQQVARGSNIAASSVVEADLHRDPSAQQEAENSERLRLLQSETAFRREANDLAWGGRTVTFVQTALAGNGSLRNQVRSVECRAQTCRVEFNAPPAALMSPEFPEMITRLGAVLPNVVAGRVDRGDGTDAAVLYMSR